MIHLMLCVYLYKTITHFFRLRFEEILKNLKKKLEKMTHYKLTKTIFISFIFDRFHETPTTHLGNLHHDL